MRKIKSVKLKNDYRDKLHFICEGSELTNNNTCYWWLYNSISFHEDEIKENKTDLFAIEYYEPEGFEFKPFPPMINFNNKLMNNTEAISELNRLADWCDGQSEKNKDEAILYFAIYTNPKNELQVSFFMFTVNQGLKFNSRSSTMLFITELNKPENSDYKKYFIELLKKTRL